jgi:spore coat protein U-like protein
MAIKYLLSMLICLVMATVSDRAHAQACDISVTDLNFGTLRLTANAMGDTSSTVDIACSGEPNATIRLCPTLAAQAGTVASTSTLLRIAGSRSDSLQYRLYADAARSVPFSAGIDVALDAQGAGKAKATIYGRLHANTGGTRQGTYSVIVDLGWVGDYADAAVCAAGASGLAARRTVKPVTTKVVATPKK